MTAETIIEVLRKENPHLASEYGVKRLGVFGSHAKGLATEASDVDLVVEFTRPIGFKFVEFTEYLENLLGKSVDVLTPAGIEGIRIERIAQSIQESVVYV
jgi:predicted nucleotidyltransferase